MWMMLHGLVMSARTLVSAVIVFVLVNYFFGILGVLMIGDSSSLENAGKKEQEVQQYFSGLDEAMFTLLQIVTGDAWSSGIARPIVKVIPGMWIYFTAYIAVASFVLMNLITAIIVENALEMAAEDDKQ